MSERLPYIDHVLSTYLWAKDHMLKHQLTMQVFAFGHANDIKHELRPYDPTKDDIEEKKENVDLVNTEAQNNEVTEKIVETIPKMKIAEKEEIPFYSLMPSGSKIVFYSAKVLKKSVTDIKESIIRNAIGDAEFPLFPDDMIIYSFFNKKEVIVEGYGAIGELVINVKEIREKFKINEGELIFLNFKVERYGETRDLLEEMSYTKDINDTYRYLDYLTSKNKITNELFDLLKAGNLNILDERIGLYNLKKTQDVWTRQYLQILCDKLPDNFYFPDEDGVDKLEDIVDVAGIIENTGGNFTNDEICNEMKYYEQNVRCQMLKEYILDKTSKE